MANGPAERFADCTLPETDRDPYLVVDQGRLFWIQDAYTIADGFPIPNRLTTDSVTFVTR